MVQIIGLMMAAYIFTRMVDTLTQEASTKLTKTCAVLTAIFAVIGALMLIAAGSSPAPRIPY